VHADLGAAAADIVIPPQYGTGFNRNPRLDSWRQHPVTVSLILLLEQFAGRHADHPRPHPLLFQVLISGEQSPTSLPVPISKISGGPPRASAMT
jgi:hypothetical protein